jgi:cyclin B
MTSQVDVNEKMRAILIDWLIEVHLKFKLMPETMYVTVNVLDRFLAKKSVQRNKLQLVGVTAMFIASKYEEIYAPEVRDFVFISDKAYSSEEILRMEGAMLGVLNFNVTAPSPYVFLKRFVKVAGFLQPTESREERLCSYLVELTLQEYRMLKYLPSVIAAAAVCLAQKMLRIGSWVSERANRAPEPLCAIRRRSALRESPTPRALTRSDPSNRSRPPCARRATRCSSTHATPRPRCFRA